MFPLQLHFWVETYTYLKLPMHTHYVSMFQRTLIFSFNLTEIIFAAQNQVKIIAYKFE